MHDCKYSIMVSKLGDPILRKSIKYGMMTPLPQDLRDLCTDRILIVLLYNYEYDIEKVALEKRLSEEVDRVVMKKQVMNPFVHYDLESGTIEILKLGEECEYVIFGDEVSNWSARVFR